MSIRMIEGVPTHIREFEMPFRIGDTLNTRGGDVVIVRASRLNADGVIEYCVGDDRWIQDDELAINCGAFPGSIAQALIDMAREGQEEPIRCHLDA